MIRDFSLVFVLLISDRRNLNRDSRRDTEQNVPWQCIGTQVYENARISFLFVYIIHVNCVTYLEIFPAGPPPQITVFFFRTVKKY